MSIPDSVTQLAQARMDARAAKDFKLADKYREDLMHAGYEVVDVAGGYELRPKKPYITLAYPRDIRPIDLENDVTVGIIVDGFTDDALETVRTLKSYSDCAVAIIAIGDAGALFEEMDKRTYLISVAPGASWADCANVFLEKVASKYVVVMDPSTQFTGDAISPVIDELAKGQYVAVGWRGGLVNLEDQWRSVDDKGIGEVDVLFSYFMAFNREAITQVGGFNPRAVYYRNADIEFSLKIRQAGGKLLQMDLPLTQGRHHGYHDVDPDYRDAQSKKTFDRILEKFRGKEAILSPRR
ncbi:MAG: hypothetical protein EB049_06125 [Actinobacteria bacterium]|nr:hypothetical protein [Actinomycetota bacterium]NCX52860.1 hypothetical protein [Actinomycetota bacterium]NDE66252.1 hypothetical protein [Actinomycetota bacterium]